jgi:hypothetical protein
MRINNIMMIRKRVVNTWLSFTLFYFNFIKTKYQKYRILI